MKMNPTYFKLVKLRNEVVLQIKWARYAIYKTPMASYRNNYQLAKLQVDKLKALEDKLKAIDFTINVFKQGQQKLHSEPAAILRQIGYDSFRQDGHTHIVFFKPQHQ